MGDHQVVDITELAVLGEQFPGHLMQLGFRLVQVMDEHGQDQVRYVLPPICTVPAGSFLMGSTRRQDPQAGDQELPQHLVTLDDFAIGAYPLTVAEYACFVQATSHAAPGQWDRQQTHADHPVVAVSWHDVLEYAQWLAQVTGEGWRLPTEAEWEKAARGTGGRIYPWGDEWDNTRANTSDGGPQATTAVGSYLGDMSPYGVYDMAGNVEEWTSTLHKPYPYQAQDGREALSLRDFFDYRVVRGGSWDYPPLYARVAARNDNPPSALFGYRGGRLVYGAAVG